MTHAFFDWTAEERAAKAVELRSGSLVATNLTPEMEAVLARVAIHDRRVPTRVGPARVLVVTPPGSTQHRPCFVNIHGGGFVRGYQKRDTVFCAELALALDAVVVDLDYRLAPEHPFPAALHESHDVTAWVFAEAASLGVDPARIAVGGHSAGGNLTAGICQMANQSGAFRPCGQILDYPFVDGVTPPEDKIEPQSIFPVDRLHAFNALYAARPEALSDPLLSPVLAGPEALAGQPPALIITAGLDPLRFEARRYAGMLIAAGADVDVRQFRDCDHGFLIAGQGRWQEGRRVIADWLAARFAA